MNVKDRIFGKGDDGITEDKWQEMVEKGIVDEKMNVLHIPPDECRKIDGATLVNNPDGSSICVLRVFKKPGDENTVVVKKLRLAEE